MTRAYHMRLPFRNHRPRHAGLRPIGEWPEANQNLYMAYRRWLVAGGYGETEYECWAYSDYSDYAQAQFRAWLKDRYKGDLSALNKAWEDSKLSDMTGIGAARGLSHGSAGALALT